MHSSAAYQVTLLERVLFLIFYCSTFLPALSAQHGPTSPPTPGIPASGHPGFLSPQFQPLAIDQENLFVANTPSDTIDVIDRDSSTITRRIRVGIEPVSLAIHPDNTELWVANHVSDSVSIIDISPNSPSQFVILDTLQDIDPIRHSTRFDEPVGIAFANNSKAYVALSSNNKIAVIDVASRKVTKYLTIPAQDPRAITVSQGKLYVLPFESGNQTQLSGGTTIDGDLVTFDAWEHSIRNNNVLSLGHVVDIVKHPRVPDRDLFIFDTSTDALVQSVSSIGTLLYGMTVNSKGDVYIAQTDARNDANGRAGSEKHGLAELQNRPFLNRITKVSTSRSDTNTIHHFELEPTPPQTPDRHSSLATPFAIRISHDESTLVATASASDTLFTLDAASGRILGRVTVGSTPQGIALEHSPQGELTGAWVLNAVDNSISQVDLGNASQPKVRRTLPLPDPTPPLIKQGRRAFETARASSTGTFSCASCHPNGHTDQLLWVLATPVVSGGNQIMPRSTMPVRGLRDTEPYHWDGIPGDPYGGINSANIHRRVEPNSTTNSPLSSIRQLLDGALSTTMRHVEDTTSNDETMSGYLDHADRDAMASFLLSIPYPPAPERSFNNELSSKAQRGFSLFHIEGDLDPAKREPNVCGDCHRMPYWVSTDTPGTGMDAPTWRGAYDRWLILPQGRLNIIDFDFYRRVAEQGADERSIWRFSWGGRERFDPVWSMVLEGSTGFPGAFARQLTLNQRTAADTAMMELLASLEIAASEGTVLLQGEGTLQSQGQIHHTTLNFSPIKGTFVLSTANKGASLPRTEMIGLARKGELSVTLTARLNHNSSPIQPQPALWPLGPVQIQRGHQQFPVITPEKTHMTISARHVEPSAFVLVDGHRTDADLVVAQDVLTISLDVIPAPGTHFIQVQNPGGLCSNDFIFQVANGDIDDRNQHAQNLLQALAQHSWADIGGTWTDDTTRGRQLKLTFDWLMTHHALQVTIESPGTKSVSLVTLNPKTQAITQTGTDNHGTSSIGKWEFNTANNLVIYRSYQTKDGERGPLQITYARVGRDTLNITVHTPQPVNYSLHRLHLTPE